MTALLSASGLRASPPSGSGPRRPLVLGAALAGAAAAGSVLMGCLAVGLVGWFASDAGAHGDTRDALRVGADAWLLAHGAGLDLATATISVVPLGLTVLCAYVAFRLGRWAVLTSAAEEAGAVVLGAVVLAAVYGVVAVVTAVVASVPHAEPHLGRAFAGAFLVALLGGGVGLLSGAGLRATQVSRLPESFRAVVRGALASVLLLVAAAAVLVTVAVLADLGAAATVLSRLHTDAAGGLLYTLVVAAVAPNAVLLGGAYLLGPGFAVGTGTLVSPFAVTTGPLPAFPLLAALPAGGTPPWWTMLLTAAPVLASLAAAVLMVRRDAVGGVAAGALRGLAAGVGGAVLTVGLVRVAGGSVGPGRMADVGAVPLDILLAAVASMGLGGLVGGAAAAWWLRRGAAGRDESTRDTVSG
jgi:hypothetical protein